MAPKSKKATKLKTKESTTATSQPDWPPLTPRILTSSLTLDILVSSQIMLIRNLFTRALCERYTSFLSSLPLTTTPLTKSRDLAVRVNDRYQIDDPPFAARLWSQTALRELVLGHDEKGVWSDGRGPQEVLGLNANVRIYRYRPGQFFYRHYDDSNSLSFQSEDGKVVPGKTTWTLLIYLSGCEGGETVFYPEGRRGEKKEPAPVSVVPEAGLALLHRHGEQCMMHEGRKVTAGEKWVLRSDLVVKR